MRYNKLMIFLSVLMSYTFVCAQTQQGYVKTKGRLGNNGTVIAGTRLQGATVIVKGGNSVVSRNNGTFSLAIPANSYFLQNVQKQGYVLTDPDVLSRQYDWSKNPLVLVLETSSQQADDKLAAERKIRRTLQRQLQDKEDEIEALKEQQKLSEEEYRKQLQEIYAQQENNERLIREMADRYSRMDFDEVDEFNRRIGSLILEGKLTEADSLINAKGDINSRVAQLRQHQEANALAEQELRKMQKKIAKSKALTQKVLEDLAQDCYSKFEIFKLQHLNDSAAYYIELRASLDTTNIKWLLDAGNFVEEYLSKNFIAMQYYQSALFQIKERYTYDDGLLNRVLNDMGLLYEKEDSLTQALICFEEAKSYLEKDDVSGLSAVYRNIGSVFLRRGELAKTQEYYGKALKLELERAEVDRNNLAGAYTNLGVLYSHQGKYEQARECHQKALDNWLALGSEETPSVALAYHNLASVFNTMGKYEQTMECENKSQAIYQTIYEKNHPAIANSYNELGAISHRRGDYDSAARYYTNAVEIYKEIYGAHHSDVALILNNLGQVYQSKSDFKKAHENYNAALAIYKTLLGEENLYVATIYTNIGVAYYYQSHIEHALEYQEKALNIRKKLLKANHPSIASSYKNIGLIYKTLGKIKEGMEYMLQALETDKSIYGENHPEVALDYHNIAGAYQSLKEFDKSLEYNQKALAIRQSIYGEQHSDVARSYLGIGNSHLS